MLNPVFKYLNRSLYISLGNLLLLFVTIFYYPSVVIGPILFFAYMLFCSLWAGRVFFKDHFKFNQVLFGFIIVLCWIVVSEGLLAILKVFTPSLVMIPLIILPLFFSVIDRGGLELNNEQKSFLLWERKDFYITSIFIVSFLSLIVIALSVRTDKMIFSVWEVIPLYFWPLIFFNILSFLFLQKRLYNKQLGFEITMISSFLIAFLYFGIMIIVAKISFDPDIWGLLSGARVIFDLGGRDPTGSSIVIQYSGYQGFLATIAVMCGNTFNTEIVRWVAWLWSPLLASIYIPFITYQFLKRFFKNQQTNIFFLGIIAFMIFPSFWLMSVSVAEMVGDILLLINLFFITISIFDSKLYHGLFLTALTTLAILFIHPISGTFAIMSDLVAIPFYTIIWKHFKIRNILIIACLTLASVFFLAQFFFLYPIIFKISNSFELTLPTLHTISNFWLSPIWLPQKFTADSICSEIFNWIRYAIVFIGFILIKRSTKSESRIIYLVILTIIAFWIGWFITITSINNLPYGTHRFARALDIALVPLCGAMFYSISKIENVCLLINNQIYFNRESILSLRIKTKNLLKVSLSHKKILAFLLIGLTIASMMTSFYIAYSIPSMFKSYPANTGRPTWRTVSQEEMQIVQLINSSSSFSNYCVLSNGFIPQLIQGMLGYRFYGTEPNLAISPGVISTSTSKLLSNPSASIVYESMIATNSSIAYFVTEDWYLGGNTIYKQNMEKLKKFASDYEIIGSEYNLYYFKFDIEKVLASLYNHPVDAYNVINPIVLMDDEQSDYWIPFEELSGKIGKPNVYTNSVEKMSGRYSTEVIPANGNYGRVGIFKNFNTSLDLSAEKYLSMFLYATNSSTISIYFMAPTPSDSLIFTFYMNWEGWQYVKIPLEEFAIVRGNPSLSEIKHVSIQFTDVTPGTKILIDKIEVSR